MKTARTEMVLSFSEAPTSLERVAEDRRARMQRATVRSCTEQIPCPGGCGNMASLESPITITGNDVTRTVRVAQCLGDCRQETKNPRTGRPRSTPARFDIPWESPNASPEEGEPGSESLAQALSRTLSTSGITQCEAGALIGCSQSSVSKLLRGLPVSTSTMSAAQQWINTIEGGLIKNPPEGGTPKDIYAPNEANGPDQAPWAGEALTIIASHEPKEALAIVASPSPIEALAISQPPSPCDVSQQGTEMMPELPSELTACPPRVVMATPEIEPGLARCSPENRPVGATATEQESPYQAVIRRLLEQVAQDHLERVAGSAAAGIRVRVSLEWAEGCKEPGE